MSYSRNKLFEPIKPSIQELPSEILTEIFSYLSTLTLASKVQFACKRWKTLGEDPLLWKCISFKGSRSVPHIPAVLSKYPLVEFLIIENLTLSSTIFKALSMLPNLEDLRLYECTFFLGSADAFCSLMSSTPLTTLELRKCCIDDMIFNMLSRAKHLQDLRRTDEDLQVDSMSKIIYNCKALKRLNINKFYTFSEETIEQIFNLRSHALVEVAMRGVKLLGDSSLRNLGNCCNITKFCIRCCDDLTDHFLNQIGKLLHLQFFELSCGTIFSVTGLVNLFGKGKFAKKLTHLDLTRCTNLDDECLSALADNCQNIDTLCVKLCLQITDKGINQLVKKCTKLKVLGVSLNDPLKGHFLKDLIFYLKELKILDIRVCRGIEKALINTVIQSRPSIRAYKT